MERLTTETLQQTANIIRNFTGQSYKVESGNNCYGLSISVGHGREWILNGMTKRQLNESMWGIIRTLSHYIREQKKGQN